MPSFLDTFDRQGPQFGNGWRRTPKLESWVGQALESFLLQNQRMEAPSNPRWFYYRDSQVPPKGVYKIVWKCSRDKMFAELVFRFSPESGANRPRFAVVVHGTGARLVQRTGDAGLSGSVNGTETIYGAGWTRLSDVDFTITVTVTGNFIKVYDSASPVPEEPVVEVTTSALEHATGIGVGNGYVDSFEVQDFSTAPVTSELDFDDAEVVIGGELVLSTGDLSASGIDSQQRVAGLVLPDYLALEGIPRRTPAFIANLEVQGRLGNEVVDTSGQDVDPRSIDTGMLYRWIPAHEFFGAGVWNPFVNKHSAATNFVWRLHRPNLQGSARELQRKDDFSYRSTLGTMIRPSLTFEGQGVLQLEGPLYPFVAMTMAMVIVPRPGKSLYGLFTEDRSDPNMYVHDPPMSILRRDTGSIEWGYPLAYRTTPQWQWGSGWWERYQTTSRPNRPILVIVTWEAQEGRGSILVQDQRRYHVGMRLPPKISDEPATYWNMWLGAQMTTLSEFNPDTAARMQLLEVAFHYEHFDAYRMIELASVMSAMYGVGP